MRRRPGKIGKPGQKAAPVRPKNAMRPSASKSESAAKKPKRQSTMLWKPEDVEAAKLAAAQKDGEQLVAQPLPEPEPITPGAEGSAGAASAAVSSSSAPAPEAASTAAADAADAADAAETQPEVEAQVQAPAASVAAGGMAPVDHASEQPGRGASASRKKAPARTMIGLPGMTAGGFAALGDGADAQATPAAAAGSAAPAAESPWGAPQAADGAAPAAAGTGDAGIVIEAGASVAADSGAAASSDEVGIVIDTSPAPSAQAAPTAQATEAASKPAPKPDGPSYAEASRRGFTREGRDASAGGSNMTAIAIGAVVLIAIIIFLLMK